MLDPVIIIVLALAVARMVVLMVKDKITEPISKWVVNRFGVDGWLTYGYHCTWCQGIWWAALLTYPTYAVLGMPFTLANLWLSILTFLGVAFAASYLADR
jgi:hypothetical protein